MPVDPFEWALCRDPGADPAWWDVDATADQRAIAAWVCETCPVRRDCAQLAGRLDGHASGTWAGVWLPFVDLGAPTFAPVTPIGDASLTPDDQLNLFDMEAM